MIDRGIRIFLVMSIIALAISIFYRQHRRPAAMLGDNPMVSPELIREIINNDSVLARPVTDIDLENTNLETAVVHLATASKTKIEADWKAVEDVGILRNAPVHIQLHQGTLRQMLAWLTGSAGVGQTRSRSRVGLAYVVEKDTILVSTDDEVTKHSTTEVYNIRPLIARIQASVSPSPDEPGMTPQQAIGSLESLIPRAVADQPWRREKVEMNEEDVGGLLVITETPETHRAIAALLLRLDAELKK